MWFPGFRCPEEWYASKNGDNVFFFLVPEVGERIWNMAFSAKEAHRAATFQKKRQKEQEDLQIKKKKIEEELQVGSISNKFSAHYDAIEQQLKSDTVG